MKSAKLGCNTFFGSSGCGAYVDATLRFLWYNVYLQEQDIITFAPYNRLWDLNDWYQ